MTKRRIILRNMLKPHFGGLWAPVRPDGEPKRPRPAMLFAGDYYGLRIEIHHNEPGKTEIVDDGFVYELTAKEFILGRTRSDDSSLTTIKWGLAKDRFLVFLENGVTSLWEPVSAEDLADDGYPPKLFHLWRKYLAEKGLISTLDGVVPTESSFDPAEK